jgi:hypothetical protein
MSRRPLEAAFSSGIINAHAHSQHTAKTSESVHAKASLRNKLLQTLNKITSKVPQVKTRSPKQKPMAIEHWQEEGAVFHKLRQVSANDMASEDGHDTDENTPAGRYHRNGMDMGCDNEKLEEFRKNIVMASAEEVPCAVRHAIALRNSRTWR